MEQNALAQWLDRYLSDELNQQEIQELDAILEATPVQTVLEVMQQHVETIAAKRYDFPTTHMRIKKNIEARIFNKHINQEEIQVNQSKAEVPLNGAAPFTKNQNVIKIPFYKKTWLRYAAVVLVIVGAVIYSTLFLHPKPSPEIVASVQDKLPGTNKARLILSNGNEILLDSISNGLLASEGKTDIVKTATGAISYEPNLVDQKNHLNGKDANISVNNLNNTQAPYNEAAVVNYNTIITPRGGQYTVTLPDGTKVWLNAASSIHFPTTFGKDRNITITGEAYLEVATNKSKPFNITVGTMKIAVLGTSFNVNAYSEEELVKTTLITGKVVVQSGENKQLLAPGQQAGVVHSNEPAHIQLIADADVEQVIAWKNGNFSFDKTQMKEIMQQLSRWYDIDIVYEGKVPARQFKGKISRNSKLSDVLEILKESGINIKLASNKLIIMP